MRPSQFRGGWSPLEVLAVILVVAVSLIGLPLALVVGGGQALGPHLTGAEAPWVAATALALLCGIAVLGLIVALFVARRARIEATRAHQLASTEVVLRLDQRFRWSEVMDVARRLQETATWDSISPDGGASAEFDEDWNRITEYVRLFEPVYLVARDGNVSMDLIRATFGHRISPVVRNKKVIARIVGKQSEAPWTSFLLLWQMVEPESYSQWTEFLKLWQVVDANGFNRRVPVH